VQCSNEVTCSDADTVSKVDLDKNKQWSGGATGWIEVPLGKSCTGKTWALVGLKGKTKLLWMVDFVFSKGKKVAAELPMATDAKVNGWCVKNQKVDVPKPESTPGSWLKHISGSDACGRSPGSLWVQINHLRAI